MDVIADLRQGRDAHARNAWTETEEAFARADAERPLGPHDLVLWAAAAYMLGRNEDHLRRYERAHHAYVAAGETLRAASCAIWMGLHLLTSGEVGRAGGWIARSQRLVERDGRDCVERGYLLMPAAFRHQAAGDVQAAVACCAAATAIAERFGDADLFALTVHTQGQMLVDAGRVEEGLRMLDEAMVAVIAGEVGPVASGIVYCGVIVGCRAAYEPRRAQEWTAALARWCERQPDMVAFSGRCLVHRAEIMQLHGAWTEALEEARRGEARCAASGNRRAAAAAAARQGDLLRLRGELDAAEDAYRRAVSGGLEPQPGLALLRLARGDLRGAAAGIRRVLGETTDRATRAGLLPAAVEIMLAVGDLDEARRARDELGTLASGWRSDVLSAASDLARGSVALADGDADEALRALRRAWTTWSDVDAPYEAARVRVELALACRALGDEGTAALELEAAGALFTEVGAAPDAARVEQLLRRPASGDAHGLTARELQVLRRVAAGETNRAIAAELVLSERTVDRHVSNIFAKLGVSSRAAATAFAYEHALV